MIYFPTTPDEPIDQADIITGCPVASVLTFDPNDPSTARVQSVPARVIVLTQTCDLANAKTAFANVAVVFDADFLVAEGIVKPAEIKGPIRAGRHCGVCTSSRPTRPSGCPRCLSISAGCTR